MINTNNLRTQPPLDFNNCHRTGLSHTLCCHLYFYPVTVNQQDNMITCGAAVALIIINKLLDRNPFICYSGFCFIEIQPAEKKSMRKILKFWQINYSSVFTDIRSLTKTKTTLCTPHLILWSVTKVSPCHKNMIRMSEFIDLCVSVFIETVYRMQQKIVLFVVTSGNKAAEMSP